MVHAPPPMIHDSNLLALRSGLPWIFLGLLSLATSMGLWLVAPEGARGILVTTSDATGAVGSGMFLMGLLLLARGRIARRLSPFLVFAFAAWVSEFVLRMSRLVGGEFDSAALRWLCAAFACAALSRGMIWIWDRNIPEGQVETWTRTGQVFAVQVCAGLSLLIASSANDLTTLAVYRRIIDAVPLSSALVWLLIVAPYAHLLVSIRRTAKCVDSRVKVTEVLHG